MLIIFATDLKKKIKSLPSGLEDGQNSPLSSVLQHASLRNQSR